MNEDTVVDLKQFIAGLFAQQTAQLRQEWREDLRVEIAKVNQRIDRVDQKIDDLSAAVAEALEAGHEATETQLKDHEKRIVRLEHKLA
jgi:septal ring factor EnvC (AmiA/AmiB activator)